MTEERVTVPDFPELTFDETGHIYRLDGIIIPSVSAVMEPLNSAKYKGINRDVLDRAATKGTSVHNAIENYIKFEFEDVPPENAAYFNAFLDWWNEYKPFQIGSEVRIYHKILRYAGTVDLLAYIGGELTLVDYKTTSTVFDSHGIQLCAYEQALQSHGIKVQKKMILQLKKDGHYNRREFPAGDARRWQVFAACKTLYDYLESLK